MSRAFTREVDDAPDAPQGELPISPHPNLVTPRGAELIEARLSALDDELGGGGDAASVERLRREQRYWAARKSTMQVVAPRDHPTSVAFGVEVTIRRGTKPLSLRIVGEDEADPTHGRIAWTSPLAEALSEAEPGDVIEFEAGGRIEKIDVLGIRP